MKNSNSKTFEVNGISFNMILVKCPQRRKTKQTSENKDSNISAIPEETPLLKDYYIGETLVTQDLWGAVMGISLTEMAAKHTFDDRPQGIGGNYPMYYVSINDCDEFIKRLNAITGMNFRLPSEEQWDFAARGGKQRKGYVFSGSNSIDEVAWYSGNCEESAQPVMTKKANELGIYDMTGNVWEWCDSGSVRGGCYKSIERFCRISYRNNQYCSHQRVNTIGFRLVL